MTQSFCLKIYFLFLTPVKKTKLFFLKQFKTNLGLIWKLQRFVNTKCMHSLSYFIPKKYLTRIDRKLSLPSTTTILSFTKTLCNKEWKLNCNWIKVMGIFFLEKRYFLHFFTGSVMMQLNIFFSKNTLKTNEKREIIM